MRKIHCNLLIIFISAVVALAIGGIEALGLVGGQLGLRKWLWRKLYAFKDNFGTIGYVTVGVFALIWTAAAVTDRIRGCDRLELKN